jgi:hypothetical protein
MIGSDVLPAFPCPAAAAAIVVLCRGRVQSASRVLGRLQFPNLVGVAHGLRPEPQLLHVGKNRRLCLSNALDLLHFSSKG